MTFASPKKPPITVYKNEKKTRRSNCDCNWGPKPLGAAVVINYSSNPDKAEGVVNEIKEKGGDAFAVKADVSNEQEVLAMFHIDAE